MTTHWIAQASARAILWLPPHGRDRPYFSGRRSIFFKRVTFFPDYFFTFSESEHA
jgi:hypothetical protein